MGAIVDGWYGAAPVEGLTGEEADSGVVEALTAPALVPVDAGSLESD
jgi:hypothetical protein